MDNLTRAIKLNETATREEVGHYPLPKLISKGQLPNDIAFDEQGQGYSKTLLGEKAS